MKAKNKNICGQSCRFITFGNLCESMAAKKKKTHQSMQEFCKSMETFDMFHPCSKAHQEWRHDNMRKEREQHFELLATSDERWRRAYDLMSQRDDQTIAVWKKAVAAWQYEWSIEDVFYRMVEQIDLIKSGRRLYVMDGPLMECWQCGFKNIPEKVSSDWNCEMCGIKFGKKRKLVVAYKPYKALEFEEWKCKENHINDLKDWKCFRFAECKQTMDSMGSTPYYAE